MKKMLPVLVFCCSSFGLWAQNLVPNPGFETYDICPNNFNRLDYATGWYCPQWSNSCDFYHVCASGTPVGVPNNNMGYQQPHTGSGMAGIYLYFQGLTSYREYVSCQLSSPLTAGECYQFNVQVNLANYSDYNTSNIGVYFSPVALTGLGHVAPIGYTPQLENTPGNYFDTLSWTTVSGTYVAVGGEQYLMLGNFRTDSLTDTVHLRNDVYNMAYVFLDNFCLSTCSSGYCGTFLSSPEPVAPVTQLFPNPFDQTLHITQAAAFDELVLTDVYGREVFRQKMVSENVQVPGLLPGIYIYRLQGKNGSLTGTLVRDPGR